MQIQNRARLAAHRTAGWMVAIGLVGVHIVLTQLTALPTPWSCLAVHGGGQLHAQPSETQPANRQSNKTLVGNNESGESSPSADTSLADDPVRANDPVRADELVQLLGSPQYAVRERATRDLVRLADAATSTLESLPDSSSPEIRRRAALILRRVQAETLDTTAQRFLLEADPAQSYGLPGWTQFRTQVGDSRSSKLLFIDAVRCQRSLMQMIDVYGSANDQQRSGVVRRALSSLASATAQRVQRDQMSFIAPKLGDFTALMLAATEIEGQTPVVVSETIETNVHRYVFTSYLQRQGYGSCLKRLLAAWLPKTHDAMAPRVMQIALTHQLDTGSQVARRHLKSNSDVTTRCMALQCIAQFGNDTDVPSVALLLEDRDLVQSLFADELRQGGPSPIDESYSVPPGGEAQPQPASVKVRHEVRVCDLALAVAVILSHDDPAEYFPALQVQGAFGISPQSVALPANKERWRSERIALWRKNHPPARPRG